MLAFSVLVFVPAQTDEQILWGLIALTVNVQNFVVFILGHDHVLSISELCLGFGSSLSGSAPCSSDFHIVLVQKFVLQLRVELFDWLIVLIRAH